MSILSLIGLMLITSVFWCLGLINSHRLVKKILPFLSYASAVSFGIASYLILTGFVLIIIGILL